MGSSVLYSQRNAAQRQVDELRAEVAHLAKQVAEYRRALLVFSGRVGALRQEIAGRNAQAAALYGYAGSALWAQSVRKMPPQLMSHAALAGLLSQALDMEQQMRAQLTAKELLLETKQSLLDNQEAQLHRLQTNYQRQRLTK